MKKVKFECKRCGDCCQRDWDLRLDFETITQWMRERRDDLLRHVVFHPRFLFHPEYSDYQPVLIIDNGHIMFGDRGRHVCPFLVKKPNGKTLCKIHSVKPLVCREFPFETGPNGNRYVRTDALKFCRGAKDYFEKCAQLARKSLDEYMRSIPKVETLPERIPIPRELAQMLKERYENLSEEEKATGFIFPESRNKKYADRLFKRLAKIYKRLHLKVHVTSDRGLNILDVYINGDIDRMTQLINSIISPPEAILKQLLENGAGEGI